MSFRWLPDESFRRDLTGWMLQWYHPHVVKSKQSYPLSPERRFRRLAVAYSQDFYLCDL